MTFEGQEKPSLDDLAHHGVKGMHWGIRKEEETSGRKPGSAPPAASTKKPAAKDPTAGKPGGVDWAKVPQQKPLTGKEAHAALSDANTKFVNKFDGSSATGKKGLSPEQKKILIGVGIGAIAVGGILVYAKYGSNDGSAAHYKALHAQEAQARAAELAHFRELYAGKHIPEEHFLSATNLSKSQSWGAKGYFYPESYDRPEFTLPKGHTFHRISLAEEDGFSKGTYSTSSIEDYHRYLVGFIGERGGGLKQLHHVTFEATEEIKVPNLRTVLDTLDEVHVARGQKLSPEKVLKSYQSISGDNWGRDLHSQLIDALSKKGYGALVDEMDAGVIGDRPLVIFGNAMSKKVNTPITPAHLQEAADKLIELPFRKG